MEYLSVKEVAEQWGVSGRTIRDYCEKGKIRNAFQLGQKWQIPDNAKKPCKEDSQYRTKNKLLNTLRREKKSKSRDGIYGITQKEFAYHSNFLDNIELSKELIKKLFEIKRIGDIDNDIFIDHIIETSNHFKCVDYIIDNAQSELTEKMIKELYFILKVATTNFYENWFEKGKYKTKPNDVNGLKMDTYQNEEIKLKNLLKDYNNIQNKTLNDIVDFHQKFMELHVFVNGNGRLGRLIMFKECLKNNIVPFIIVDKYKDYYLHGLDTWQIEQSSLLAAILTTQEQYKKYLDQFNIEYK